ncbi:hypothetical protein Dsin_023793 [Dipteronia sinensis]|uniref:Uncharacterized protein n=1 Tax=Dipteronia sinensis TaxID=43782 RepID=A0AAE0E144_9ROSI|nr:hypothetical protein Dsin_023793 [Dipteronia sinensis]
MEEGLLRESLTDEAKPLRNGSNTTDMSKRSSKSSTITAAVEFSTSVAVCGSFCHGCAVVAAKLQRGLEGSLPLLLSLKVVGAANSIENPD